jgi:isopenicillin-N N-acyltransferase like protein
VSVTVIDITDLFGGGYQRGRQFGAARRDQIHHWIRAWYRNLSEAGIVDSPRYVDCMLRDTNFLPAIRQHGPELLEEVQGIADGAALPFDVIFAAQLMDEEWAYRTRAVARGEAVRMPSDPMVKCSSVAIATGNGRAWIGQNMDLGAYTDGHQLLLRSTRGDEREQVQRDCAGERQDCGHGSLIFTIGGMLALMGVNSRGLGVCVNSLPQLPFALEGVPVTFVIRKLLEAANVEEAVKTLRSLSHATGQHYLIADANSIRSFEASSREIVEYHSPDPMRVLHTNHPLTHPAPHMSRDESNSIARLRSLSTRLMCGQQDSESVKAALSSSDDPEHPVCRVVNSASRANTVTGTINFTTGSMVSALARDALMDCWVSNGPPAARGYTRIEW